MAQVMSTTGKIAKGEYVNEWRQAGGDKWVHKCAILGTDFIDYDVWEPRTQGYNENGRYFSSHSTYTFRDTEDGGSQCLGDMTTRDLPPELDALPAYSDERYERVHAYFIALKEEARAIVLETFPEDFN